MLLAGLHCHHRPVGAIGRLTLLPSTSSRINRRHVETSVSARTLKPERRVTAEQLLSVTPPAVKAPNNGLCLTERTIQQTCHLINLMVHIG